MITNLKRKIKSIKRRLSFIPFKVNGKQTNLLMKNGIYPHPISGFSYEEFTYLLKAFKNSKIILNPTSYVHFNTPVKMHKEHVQTLEQNEPGVRGKLVCSKSFVNVNTKLFYCLFLNGIVANLSWLEKYKIPFVFTLYPGGGFQLNNAFIDAQLERVFNSPMFKKVIVTQLVTKDYLLEKELCEASKIEYIFGCVVPQISIEKDLSHKVSYLKGKQTFDVCFCSAKYMPLGSDKGYDVFIDFAHKISKQYDFVRFHVIGGFSGDDIDVKAIATKITFYGYQEFSNLNKIYEKMDVFISPNRPFVLHEGGFDGFPLGTAVEAALNGAVLLVTDYLNQNDPFVSGEDLILIDADADNLAKEVSKLIQNPERLYDISIKGKEAFSSVYKNDVQMRTRVELLNTVLSEL